MNVTHEYTQLKNARYMSLKRYPDTLLAKRLCLTIAEDITRIETRTRARKKQDKISFEAAIGRVIGDILISYNQKKSKYAHRSIRRTTFGDGPIRIDTFLGVIHPMIQLGYLNEVKGGNLSGWNTSSFHPGLSTRFSATQSMIDLTNRLGLALEDLEIHFKREPSLDEIRLKAASVRNRQVKTEGKLLRVPNTVQTDEIRSRLNNINTFLLQQSYDGMAFYGLRRIYNEGDSNSFNWDMGGRLYAVAEDNYQRQKSTVRTSFKINGDPVVEIDINASYLRILHGLRGFTIPKSNDIYEINGLDRIYVKAWVTATLGFDRFHKSWPKMAIENIKKANLIRPKSLTMEKVGAMVLEKFPVLADWPTCGIRWSHLMFHESEALMRTIEVLQSRGIPSLPVHDSLIVPAKHEEVAQKLLVETFEEEFGVSFIVSVKRNLPAD